MLWNGLLTRKKLTNFSKPGDLYFRENIMVEQVEGVGKIYIFFKIIWWSVRYVFSYVPFRIVWWLNSPKSNFGVECCFKELTSGISHDHGLIKPLTDKMIRPVQLQIWEFMIGILSWLNILLITKTENFVISESVLQFHESWINEISWIRIDR